MKTLFNLCLATLCSVVSVRAAAPATPNVIFIGADDPGETRNVAAQHPGIVARLGAAAEAARRELGDLLRNRRGEGLRAPGFDPAEK